MVMGRAEMKKGIKTKHGKMINTDFICFIIFPGIILLYTSLVPFLVTTHVCFFFILFVVSLEF